VIEAGSRQTGDSRHTNDEKTFVALSFVAGKMLQLRAATIEIGLQDVGGDEQRSGYHQAESGNGDRAEMQKRNHKLDRRVYMAARRTRAADESQGIDGRSRFPLVEHRLEAVQLMCAHRRRWAPAADSC